MLQVHLPGLNVAGVSSRRKRPQWGLFCVLRREEGVLVYSCFHVEDVIQRGMNNNDLHVKEGVFLVKQWPAGDGR